MKIHSFIRQRILSFALLSPNYFLYKLRAEHNITISHPMERTHVDLSGAFEDIVLYCVNKLSW